MRRILVTAAAAVATGLVVAAVAVAATKPKPKVDPGLKVFKGNCSKCHTLAAAKAKGQGGPDLDSVTVKKAFVVTQVTNGGHFMPGFKGVLTKKQIADVATFVAANAGKG